MIKRELIIDKWNTSYFDNYYDDPTKDRKGTTDRRKLIPTNVFLNKIKDAQRPTSLHNDMLPPNCRYSTEIDDLYKLFVIEEPPQMRTIFLDYDMSMTVANLKASGDLKKFGYENWFKENRKPYKFYLAFPYLVYIIVLDQVNNFKQVKVFARVTPLSSFGDYICRIPLMNINGNQQVCTGSLTSGYSRKNTTSAISGIIKTFWQNIFNKDYIYNVQAYSDIPFVSDYLTWQYYSQIDPMFIYNIEWIPFDTIGFEISKSKNGYTRQVDDDVKFQTLIEKVFYKPTPTSKVDKKTKTHIYDNVSDSINIERIPIFVNDSFMLRNKRVFVRSFMSPRGDSQLSHVKLQDSNKKTIIYKLTRLFKNHLRKSIMEERFIQSTTLEDGSVVKQGCIIKSINVHGNEIYNKIKYMRYGLDGKIEARIRSSLMALEDMKNLKVMDMKKLIVNKIKLRNGKEYNITFRYNDFYSGATAPIKILRKLVLNDVDISSSGKIIVFFEDTKNHNTHSINIDDLNKRLVSEKGFKKLPTICRVGTSLIANNNISINSNMSNYLFMDNASIRTPDYNEAMKVIFKDKKHLFIESFDMDLSFKIGDKVVTSNWISPVEMLKVKTITGFLTKSHDLNILLEDQHGNKSEHAYLHRSMSNLIVNVGTLRHIEKEYDGMTSGFKIKAKKSKISNFPMKDVNIIIGFLTDTGGDVPLALCSNGATLWADELKENFDLITMSNKKWKSLKHTPIIDQRTFKYQPGDITTIPYDTDKYTQNLLTIQHIGDKIINQYLTEEGAVNPRYTGYFNSELKPVVNRIGFLNPRYSQPQMKRQRFIKAYPNFHGMYNFNPSVRMKYHVDERRILNVSDISV